MRRTALYALALVSGLTLLAGLSPAFGQGVVAYWRFDEGTGVTAADSAGDHDGTLVGMPDWISGQVGSALYFESYNYPYCPWDHVLVNHDPALNIPTNELSIEAWVTWEGTPGRDYQIVSKETGYLQYGYQFRLINGELALVICNGIDYTTCGVIKQDGHQFPTGNWHHVVGVYSDSQDLARLYVDGAPVKENTAFTSSLNNSGNTEPLLIGTWKTCGEYHPWPGKIDEVAIYDRVLTPEEVLRHYESGLHGVGYFDAVRLSVDIKPGSCPNPLNPRSRGVVTVAVAGSPDFDVSHLDPPTLALTRSGFPSVSPLRWSYEDVATPYAGEPCGCHGLGGDGIVDLVLKFDTQQLVGALGLAGAQGNVALTLEGSLKPEAGGTPAEGADCVKIVP